jgi:hypothetical protein
MGRAKDWRERTGNRFGILLRAARLRYHQIPGGDGLLRISVVGKDRYFCELHPFALLPNGRAEEREHVIWWRDEQGRLDYSAIKASPYLRSIRRVKESFSVVLGDDGLPVQEAAS